MSFTTGSLTNRKTIEPAGTAKMKNARTSWSPIPQMRTRPLTTFRRLEKHQG